MKIQTLYAFAALLSLSAFQAQAQDFSCPEGTKAAKDAVVCEYEPTCPIKTDTADSHYSKSGKICRVCPLQYAFDEKAKNCVPANKR